MKQAGRVAFDILTKAPDVSSRSPGVLGAVNTFVRPSRVFGLLGVETRHEAYIEIGVTGFISLVVAGQGLAKSAQDARLFWKFANTKERLRLLGDITVDSVRVSNNTLVTARNIAQKIAFLGLIIPVAFFSLMVSAIEAVLVIARLYRHEKSRTEMGSILKDPTDRNQKLLAFIDREESRIDKEINTRRAQLKQRGAADQEIERFLTLQRKWALKAFLGVEELASLDYYKSRLLAAVHLEKEMAGLSGEKLSYVHQRYEEVKGQIDEAVIQLQKAIKNERKVAIANCVAQSLFFVCSVIVVVAMFATIKFWGPVVLGLTALGFLISVTITAIQLYKSRTLMVGDKEMLSTQIALLARQGDQRTKDLFGYVATPGLTAAEQSQRFEHYLIRYFSTDERVRKVFSKKMVELVAQARKKSFKAEQFSRFKKTFTPFFEAAIARQLRDSVTAEKTRSIAGDLTIRFLHCLDTYGSAA